jgi:hypothetical protein
MLCSHCNQEHPEGTQFCPMTGKKIILPNICPECGQLVDPQWLHCSNCGQMLIPPEEIFDLQEAQATSSSQIPITMPESSKTINLGEPIEHGEETSSVGSVEINPVNDEPIPKDEISIEPFVISENESVSTKKTAEPTQTLEIKHVLQSPVTDKKIILPDACPDCGQAVDLQWQHCSNCGQRLIPPEEIFELQESQVPIASQAAIAMLESSKTINLGESIAQDKKNSVGSVEDIPVISHSITTDEISTETFAINEGEAVSTEKTAEATQMLEIKQVLRNLVIQEEQVDLNIPAESKVLTPEKIESENITGKPALRCPHCNTEHPEGTQFCPVTGEKITLPDACPDCGQSVDPQWQHCSNCGHILIPPEEKFVLQEAQAPSASQAAIAMLVSSKTINLGEPITQDEKTSLGSVEDIPVISHSITTDEISTETFAINEGEAVSTEKTAEPTQTFEIKQGLQSPIIQDEQVDINIPVESKVLTPEEIKFKQITGKPALRCSHCNEEHPEGSQFCPVTGRKIALPDVCPGCGKSVDPNWPHCGYCGRELIPAMAIPHRQEPQAIDSPKVRWLILGALIVVGCIICLLIGTATMYYVFWKVKSSGEATPIAIIALTQAATLPVFTPMHVSATMPPSAALTQATDLPTATNTPSIPNCPGNKIQSVNEVYKNEVMLLEICANDQITEIGNLAYGVSRIGPNNMFFIYITLYGDVYAARVGDVKLTYLGKIKFFTMINKDDMPKLEIGFLGKHPYKLYVKEAVLKQNETIPIPRYITSPSQ